MKFVINEPESEQSIYVEQIDHGKFAKISSTSLLLNVGALGPALRAGSPVTGSVTSLTRCSRLRRGVNTIRPFSIFASSGSPARMSSRRRSGAGRTTCPLVETLVCTVRQSYLLKRDLARMPHSRRGNEKAQNRHSFVGRFKPNLAILASSLRKFLPINLPTGIGFLRLLTATG